MKHILGNFIKKQTLCSINSCLQLQRAIFSILLLALTISLTGMKAAQAQDPEMPAGPCSGSVRTDRAVIQLPPLPTLKPVGQPFCDPTFGTQIMRVTDQSTDNGKPFGSFYSTWPTFNSKSTRLLVRKGIDSYSAVIYDFDPATFTLLAKHEIPALPDGGTLNAQGAIWSNTNPDILYGVSVGHTPKLWELNVRTNSYTNNAPIKDFSNIAGVSASDYLWQMSMSDNNDVFAFTVRSSDEADKGFLVYKRSINQLLWDEVPVNRYADFNEVKIDRTGRYLSIPLNHNKENDLQDRYDDESYYVLDLQTGTHSKLADNGYEPWIGASPSHSDVGSSNLLAWDRWENRFLYRDFDYLQRYVVALPRGGDWSQNVHVSMLQSNGTNNKERWGLLGFNECLEDARASCPANSQPHVGPFDDELVQVETNGSQRVRRLLHHRSVVRLVTEGSESYWDLPFANISRDGRFIAFTSNWGESLGQYCFTQNNQQVCRKRQDLFIAQIAPAPTNPLAIRINAGGGYYTSSGNIWQNDEYFHRSACQTPEDEGCVGAHGSTDKTIQNTSDQPLYQTERYGTKLTYAIPVPNGTYTVKLHFAEFYWGTDNRPGPNQRKFNVSVENNVVLSNYDIFVKAGGALKPVIEQTTANVTDRVLNIEFTTIPGYDYAKISAIEVLPKTVVPTNFWQGNVNAAISGTGGVTLTKNNSTDLWDAGAYSTKSISMGQSGYLEFTAAELGTGKMCGLTKDFAGTTYTTIDFAISLGAANLVRIYENNSPKGPFGQYKIGDKYRISVEGGKVKYYQIRDGVTTPLYTNENPTLSSSLVADASLQTGSTLAKASIKDARLVITTSPPAGAPQAPPETMWTNDVGVNISTNTLTKQEGLEDTWDAGASSLQSLTGDGYVEFTAADTTSTVICGLNMVDANRTYQDIDYGIFLNANATSSLRIYEKGLLKFNAGTYMVGDRFRVAIESGQVNYYLIRGDTIALLYTSGTVPTSPVVVDTSLYSFGSNVTDVVLSGNWEW